MLYAYLNNTVVAPDPTLMHSCSKEMGLTPTEFKRTLPKAVNGEVQTVENQNGRTKVQVVDGPRRTTIQYRELPNRTVGSLALPRLRVDIGMSGFSHASAQTFIEKFDHAFLRMGGG